jgi:hypothetical protein
MPGTHLPGTHLPGATPLHPVISSVTAENLGFLDLVDQASGSAASGARARCRSHSLRFAPAALALPCLNVR